jgi:hypothetical protein
MDHMPAFYFYERDKFTIHLIQFIIAIPILAIITLSMGLDLASNILNVAIGGAMSMFIAHMIMYWAAIKDDDRIFFVGLVAFLTAICVPAFLGVNTSWIFFIILVYIILLFASSIVLHLSGADPRPPLVDEIDLGRKVGKPLAPPRDRRNVKEKGALLMEAMLPDPYDEELEGIRSVMDRKVLRGGLVILGFTVLFFVFFIILWSIPLLLVAIALSVGVVFITVPAIRHRNYRGGMNVFEKGLELPGNMLNPFNPRTFYAYPDISRVFLRIPKSFVSTRAEKYQRKLSTGHGHYSINDPEIMWEILDSAAVKAGFDICIITCDNRRHWFKNDYVADLGRLEAILLQNRVQVVT